MQQEFKVDQRTASFVQLVQRGVGLAVVGFMPVAATASPGHAVTEVYHRVIGPRGAAYPVVNESSTLSRPEQTGTGKVMGADETRQSATEATIFDTWQRIALLAWADEASVRIRYLSGKPDGWRGEGSVSPSKGAIDDALALVEKLQMEVPNAPPMISLDEDGEFLFFWKREGLLASIAVAGDKSYTFFGKRGRHDIICEALALADPFPPEVTEILAVREALGAQA